MKNLFNFKNGIILLVLLLMVFFTWSKVSKIMKSDDPVNVEVKSYDHVIGKADAEVTVIEYADMQCPACKAFEATINPIITEYSDRVKFVFKHFPLTQIHQNAMTAAIVVEAAGLQGKFWEAKKLVYEKQEDWGSSLEAKAKLLVLMADLGLDMDKLNNDIKSDEVKNRVINNLREATSLQLPGTPTVIINGVKVNTASIGTVELFRKYLDDKLNTQNEAKSQVDTVYSSSSEVKVSTSTVKVNYKNKTN
jgi:protein-disulfide isomerase